jgi:hypothetical protein
MSDPCTGIVCVYGLSTEISELIALFDVITEDELNERLPKGWSLYYLDGSEVIVGYPIVQLNYNPVPFGSQLAPVLAFPDTEGIDFFSQLGPLRYYEIPLG